MSAPEDLLKPKITISKHDRSEVYYSYDATSPPASGARVIDAQITDAMMEAAPFTIRIEDSGNALDANVGNGNHVRVALGTDSAGLANYVAGYVRQAEVNRIDTNVKEVILHCFTNPIRLEEILVNFYRIADRLADGESPDTGDARMKGSELFKDLFQDLDVYFQGGPKLSEFFTINGVQEVSEVLASFKEPFVYAKHVADKIAQASGSIYGIDGNDDAFLHYATLTHSGITIRDSDPAGAVPDKSKTGYFVGPWKYVKTIKRSDGFANRLVGFGGTQMHMENDEFTDSASAECHSVDRAIRFPAHAPNLSAISLKLSRVGTLPDDIAGEVRYDDDNTPDGDIVSSFVIFKDLLNNVTEGQATDINRINIALHGGRLQVGDNYWIVLKRQGDASNHFRWHHDNGTSAVEASRSGSAWTVDAAGRMFCHRTYCSRRVLMSSLDSKSKQKYGVVDMPVEAPFILEAQAMDTLLTSILQFSAKQKVIFEPRRIWSPTNPIRAGRLVRLMDTLSGLDMDAEVKRASYHFKAEQDGMGSRWCDLELVGFVE